jgi:hypothetical protein
MIAVSGPMGGASTIFEVIDGGEVERKLKNANVPRRRWAEIDEDVDTLMALRQKFGQNSRVTKEDLAALAEVEEAEAVVVDAWRSENNSRIRD